MAASVEALTSENERRAKLVEGFFETVERPPPLADLLSMLEDANSRAAAAEARVVALTAERKQELGGDGLRAVTVAQVVQAAQALVEHTFGVIPPRDFYKLREAVQALAADEGGS